MFLKSLDWVSKRGGGGGGGGEVGEEKGRVKQRGKKTCLIIIH